MIRPTLNVMICFKVKPFQRSSGKAFFKVFININLHLISSLFYSNKKFFLFSTAFTFSVFFDTASFPHVSFLSLCLYLYHKNVPGQYRFYCKIPIFCSSVTVHAALSCAVCSFVPNRSTARLQYLYFSRFMSQCRSPSYDICPFFSA